MIAAEILRAVRRGRGERDEPRAGLDLRQRGGDRQRKRSDRLGADGDAEDIGTPLAGDPRPETLRRGEHKRADGGGITEHGVRRFQLLAHVAGLERALPEPGAVALLPLGVQIPAAMERGDLRRHPQIQLELRGRAGVPMVPASAEEQGIQDGFRDALALLGDRHMRAQRAVDLAGLVQQHVEHDAVHGAVRAEIADAADGRLLLTVAVHAAVALFEAVGIPGEIVVQGGIEGVLQVDPLAETVGGHEHARLVLGELLDLGAALVIAEAAGERHHAQIGESAPQCLVQPLGQRLGGRDIAAPDDGRETRAEKIADQLGAAVELGVSRAQQRLGETAQLAQAAAVDLGERGAGGFDRRRGLLVIGAVVGRLEDEGAEIQLLVADGQGIVAALQGRHGSGGAGHHAAQQGESAPDVVAGALDEVARQLDALRLGQGRRGPGAQLGPEEGEQRAEGALDAAVGSGGEEEEVPVLLGGDGADELVALVLALVAVGGDGGAVGFRRR